MPMYPCPGHDRDSLANAVCWYLSHEGEPPEFHPVYRLDRDTTGIVLFSICKHTQGAYDALIAAELLEHKSVTLYCTGGLLQRNNGSYPFVGPDAIHLIARYRTRKCFMGCSALNFTYGLMVFSGIEAEIKTEIIKASDQIICLADYSKFHKTAFSSFLPLEELDICVTNAAVPAKDVEFLREKGVDVRIAK